MGTPVASGNRGVLALGSALIRLSLDANPQARVNLLGSHRSTDPVVMRPHGRAIPIPMVNWRLSRRSPWRTHLITIIAASLFYRCIPIRSFRRWLAATIPWVGAVESLDLVGDVRGGDSFSDIYGMQRFLLASLPVWSVILIKGKLVLFPQTYGPYKSRTSRWIARWIIRHSSVVIARDRESQAVAQALAGPDRPVLLSPDVAFALYADDPFPVQFDEGAPAPVPAGAIGLNVNGLMFNGGYTGKNMFGLKLEYRPFLTALATRLLAAGPGDLILVPHTYAPAGDVESDNDACRVLKESLAPELRRRVRVVTGDYDAHQLKGIIRQCDFFIGARMHSCIAALSQGVPCVGVAYSMKFRGVFESVGMADWVVDARSMSNDEAVAAILSLYAGRAARRESLDKAATQARQRLTEVFAALTRIPTT